MGRTRWKVASEKKLPVKKRSTAKVNIDSSGSKEVCPCCGEPLKEFEYIGTDKSILAKLASGCEEDFMYDLKEDGKVVWREKRKRSAS
jgi:uncharacterized protein (DUF2249 family)